MVGDYQFISGKADTFYIPHISSTLDVTLTTGREENQTYARVIQHPEDEFGGTLFFGGAASGEKNTDSYNESSIFYGEENENYGDITQDPSYGFGLNVLGQASGTETYDDETDTYDQDITFSNGGLTFDQGSGGVLILPSFDKTEQYDINFSDTVVSENYGTLGVSSVGNAPKYDQFLYPHYTGFSHQEIDKGYDDHGFINEEAPTQSIFPYGAIGFKTDLSAKKIQYIPNWNGSGTLTLSGIVNERVAVASSTTSLFDFVSGAEERYIAQTPEGTVLFDVSGITTYSRTRDFVGSGTLPLTRGIGISTYARVIDHVSPVGIQTFRGSAVVKSSFDPPEGVYLHIVGGAYTDLKATYAAQ